MKLNRTRLTLLTLCCWLVGVLAQTTSFQFQPLIASL